MNHSLSVNAAVAPLLTALLLYPLFLCIFPAR